MGTTDSFQLVRLQLQLECMDLDEQRLIIQIPCEKPDAPHRVLAIRHAGGDEVLFFAGISDDLRRKLSAFAIDDFFASPKRILAVLAEASPSAGYFIGSSYLFPEMLRAELYPRAVSLADADPGIARRWNPNFDPDHGAVFAVIEDGQVVSTCESSHESSSAGEAWVQTIEPYRRRGYARQVTLAWAHHLQKKGKVPFYSHLLTNLASQSLAQSMGLVKFLEAAGYA